MCAISIHFLLLILVSILIYDNYQLPTVTLQKAYSQLFTLSPPTLPLPTLGVLTMTINEGAFDITSRADFFSNGNYLIASIELMWRNCSQGWGNFLAASMARLEMEME